MDRINNLEKALNLLASEAADLTYNSFLVDMLYTGIKCQFPQEMMCQGVRYRLTYLTKKYSEAKKYNK